MVQELSVQARGLTKRYGEQTVVDAIQLMEKGIDATLDGLLLDIRERDARDATIGCAAGPGTGCPAARHDRAQRRSGG